MLSLIYRIKISYIKKNVNVKGGLFAEDPDGVGTGKREDEGG
jgi:hypothetical protein